MERQLILFRIAQEALQNCIKHAKATEVQIEVKITEGRFSLSIKDNGISFDSEVLKKWHRLDKYAEPCTDSWRDVLLPHVCPRLELEIEVQFRSKINCMKVKIAIVDDHQLFLKSLSLLINSYETFEVVVEEKSGEAFLERIKLLKHQPDIALIDVDMPTINGVQTAQLISNLFPEIKLVALSMKSDDRSII